MCNFIKQYNDQLNVQTPLMREPGKGSAWRNCLLLVFDRRVCKLPKKSTEFKKTFVKVIAFLRLNNTSYKVE